MTTPFQHKKESQEFENNSHISRKKKAEANKFTKKNHNDIIDLINEEDDEVAETYARYIK